jgi:protein-tyrosine phosphatase
MHIFNRVIVICIGNICRSSMAAAVLQDGLAERRGDVAVASAGLGRVGGKPADTHVIKLMDERGLDICPHRSTLFTAHRGLESDLILVMSSEQRHFIEGNWPLLHGRVYRRGH